jgi:PiT family inorganic phosphate transporter
MLLTLTLILAFANGANDVSKGIATLVGSGVSSYRAAVMWGSFCTVIGALTATLMSRGLVEMFSGRGILVHPSASPHFVLAVACGAIGWLLIATRTGLPVSTTHSLAGALVGAAGWSGVQWSAIAAKIALPLAVSPVIALLLLLIVLPLLRPLTSRLDRFCVCIEQSTPVTPDGFVMREAMPSVTVASSCSTPVARVGAIDAMHWISAGATSFFRALNDTPKIVALGIAAMALSGASLYALVALAMGAGSLIAGLRVTRTLAEKIVPITPANGFAANVVTSLLVGLASRFALPVSTTHVSSGAIVGIGISEGGRGLRWKTIGEMLLAWVVTLPVSALIAAGVYAVVG